MKKEIKPIKHIATIVLLLATCGSAFGKDINADFTPKHEINVGYGLLPLVPSMLDEMFVDCDPNFQPPYSYNGYNDALYYYSNRENMGAINVSYLYNAKRWLSIGATFSYHNVSESIYDRITEKCLGKNHNSTYSIIMKAKFIYLNKEWIRLYGQVGLGFGINHKNNAENSYGYNHAYSTFAGQLNLFGIEIGRRFYGYMEPVGFGSNGCYNMGIGYKF